MNRGSTFDIIIIIVFCFVGAVLFLLASTINTQFVSGIQENNLNNSAFNSASTNVDEAYNAWDNSFVFLLFGCVLAVVVTAFLIPSHPAFFVISLLGLGFVILFGALFSNVYNSIGSATQLQTASNSMDVTANVMNYLPLILLALGSLVVIVMLAKDKIFGGGGNA